MEAIRSSAPATITATTGYLSGSQALAVTLVVSSWGCVLDSDWLTTVIEEEFAGLRNFLHKAGTRDQVTALKIAAKTSSSQEWRENNVGST